MRLFLICSCVVLLAGCTAKPGGTVVSGPTDREIVAYAAGQDTVQAMLFRPAGEGPFPAMVVIHGDFGLNDWVKVQARRIARQGYMTLAVDLYRGEVVTTLLDAHIMDRGLPDNRVEADLRGAVDYLTSRADVRGDAIGIMGWDMGAGFALDTAIRDPRIRATVICYGRLTTEPQLLAPLQASVLGIFGGQDEGITPETIEQFRAAMHKAGKRLAGIHVYPDCGHGFMNPVTQPVASRQETAEVADAWRKIEAYLAAELKR
jgi:carboxymethylenebutenolidase